MKTILAALLASLVLVTTSQAALIKESLTSKITREAETWVIDSNKYQKKHGSSNRIDAAGYFVYDTKNKDVGFFVKWVGHGSPVCAFIVVTPAELKHPTGWMYSGRNIACTDAGL